MNAYPGRDRPESAHLSHTSKMTCEIRAALRTMTRESPDFPVALLSIPSPPRVLTRAGAPPGPSPAVAVVGSRRASAAGLRSASRLGRELSEGGWTVVSGLARGVDRAALEGALRGGGQPIAVLGNGLPGVYPAENLALACRIIRAGGTLLSELPVGAPPRRHHFPRRNRLITALSVGLVVVEATERSGSLTSARWALEQGREVCAFPGPADGPSHRGCHQLIRDGAHLVTEAREVVDVLKGRCSASVQVPEPLRTAFLAGERDPERLQGLSGLPTPRFLEAWRQLLEAAPDDRPGVSYSSDEGPRPESGERP